VRTFDNDVHRRYHGFHGRLLGLRICRNYADDTKVECSLILPEFVLKSSIGFSASTTTKCLANPSLCSRASKGREPGILSRGRSDFSQGECY